VAPPSVESLVTETLVYLLFSERGTRERAAFFANVDDFVLFSVWT
jgi:hypothetical protein